MRKIICIISIAALATIAGAQSNWVGFTSSNPDETVVDLLVSTPEKVSFEVSIPGIFRVDTVVNGVLYSRLMLPGGETLNSTEYGSPEFSGLSYLIAVCESDDFEIEYDITSVQTLNPGTLYPVPKIVLEQNQDGYETLVEQFYLNLDEYSFPKNEQPVAYIGDQGSLREQKFVSILVNPLNFNPLTQQLTVVDKIEISVNMANPKGNIRQNLGIFNSLGVNTFLNYECDGTSAMINDKAFEKQDFTEGTTVWLSISDTLDVHGLTADYLIVVAAPFFQPNNPESEVLRLAKHRNFYNGFDIVILNFDEIIDDEVGFSYDNYPEEDFKYEQRLRSCIRAIYETGEAHHTKDGRLGYVLLVGDYDESTGAGITPGFSHGILEFACNENSNVYASDYFYVCITKDSLGKYDDIADLYIGRFSVEDEEQLHNMVEKTIYFESEYYPSSTWRKSSGFSFGNLRSEEYHNYFFNYFYPHLTAGGKSSTFVEYHALNGEIRVPTLNYLNEGAFFSQYFGHGNVSGWQGMLLTDTFTIRLNNDMPSFINAHACHTGWFDSNNCLGEILTRYSPTRGAVGYIGGSRLQFENGYIDFKPNMLHYWEFYPHYLFQKHFSIAGELMHLCKINGRNDKTSNKFGYNLFGDPALNIFAEGFEVTRDLILDSQTALSCEVTVRNSGSLTIPVGGELKFENNSQLIVEEGGNLFINDYANLCLRIDSLIQKPGTLIIVPSQTNTPAIDIKCGGFTVGTGVEFNNLAGGVTLNGSQSVLFDNSKTFTLNGVTFNNTPLIHGYSHLNIYNCDFTDSDVLTSVSKAAINNCTFSRSSVVSDQTNFLGGNKLRASTTLANNNFFGNNANTALYVNSSPNITCINNQIHGYDKGISLHNSGLTLAQSPSDLLGDRIYNNKVYGCGIGIELLNSTVDFKENYVHNNIDGIRLLNNSYTAFYNHPQLTTKQQIVRDNNALEFYMSANSFPIFFHHNQIIDEDNIGNPRDPLLYWDFTPNPQGPAPTPQNIILNYWGENFDARDDLYPIGLFNWNPVWQPKSGTRTAEDIYNEGLEYFAEEDFINAEASFIELIEEHAQTNFAKAAMHELFALRQFTDFNFDGLKNYFSTFTESDSTLYETAQFLATRCNIKLKQWQPAIDWYENRIENPPSYPDSVFAVIDLGDIHLMMESDDDMELKSTELIISRFPEIKPKSKEAFETNKSALLATLPQKKVVKPEPPIAVGNEKGALGQNIPNPARVSTTVEYAIYTEGNVEIKLFNSLGQIVQTISEGTKETGTYSVEIPLSKIPEGFYHYALYINGERVEAKTLVRY